MVSYLKQRLLVNVGIGSCEPPQPDFLTRCQRLRPKQSALRGAFCVCGRAVEATWKQMVRNEGCGEAVTGKKKCER